MRPRIRVLEDAAALAAAAARRIAELAAAATAARGCFHLALAGGRTPEATYRALAALRPAPDWSRVHVWFGDERCVPPDHPESNYGMAQAALLDHVPVPRRQVHPILVDAAYVREAAAGYAAELAHQAPRDEAGQPCLDLALLGLGADGHTASLFPGSCVLAERERPVSAVYVDRLHSWRVSLTPPALEAARHLLFLVCGADKARTVQRALDPPAGTPLPVQRLQPHGEVEWYLDRAAAARLSAEPAP